MGRAPCCDQKGLKKGPWSAEEDVILINYVSQYGHGNWRALPKRAGLLRCGKSCRLRWMNYLRPDIKRGNFSPKEEETIMKLHAELGNKWSVIAARLPGRTDNEIKNVWHTHLKKRVNAKQHPVPVPEPKIRIRSPDPEEEPNSPALSSSDASSAATAADGSGELNICMKADSLDGFREMEEGFWSEVFPGNEWCDFSAGGSYLRMGGGDGSWQGQLFCNDWSEEFIDLPEIW